LAISKKGLFCADFLSGKGKNPFIYNSLLAADRSFARIHPVLG
jgi:hypothetical protein